MLCLESASLLQKLLGEEQGLMIKSSVCFFFTTPRGRNAMSLQSTDGQTASHWSALQRGMLSLVCVCVYVLWVCVMCVMCATVSLFPFPPYPLILPPSSLFSGATGCYLELSLMCAVTHAAAGGRNETHTHTHTHTHRGLKITGLCMASVYTLFLLIILILLLTPYASQPTVSDPQCTACAFICAEVAWSYIIHGSCDLRRVSYGRSNKMEYWWGYDEHNTGERDTSLPLPLPCTALFTSYTHVGAQHSFDLYRNGWPRMGQHNRCCFETTETMPVSNIF